MYNILQKYYSSLVILIKLLIIAGAYYVISDKILRDNSFNISLLFERFSIFGKGGYSLVLFILFFSVFNWILEIMKWKSLVSIVKPISFGMASSQSLASLTASLITPNRIGEYGAKAIYFKKSERPKIFLLNFIGNAYQMLVTFVFGLFGLSLMPALINLGFSENSFAIAVFTFVLILGLIGVYTFRKKWQPYANKIRLEFRKIPLRIQSKTFLFSIGRYLIFSHQFFFFLLFFGINIDYTSAMSAIFVMYFISSLIPGFVIFDWLVKGSVAVTLFHLLGVNDLVILSITASMWILNFAIPAVMGSYFVVTFDSKQLMFKKSKASG